MKTIELAAEHAVLRSLATEVERTLGRQAGVGWRDCITCDVQELLALENRLTRELDAHETISRRMVKSALRTEFNEELDNELERGHRTLHDLLALLRTISCLCDGRHVHAVRTAAGRVREELEAHLAFEEKSLFPILEESRPARPRRTVRLSPPRD